MTREEFESILEEAYIEGYNTAIEDIQEDILDEEAYDLEGEYGYYSESNAETKARNKEIMARKVQELRNSKKFGGDRENTTVGTTSGNDVRNYRISGNRIKDVSNFNRGANHTQSNDMIQQVHKNIKERGGAGRYLQTMKGNY